MQVFFQSLDYPADFAHRFATMLGVDPNSGREAAAMLFGFASWAALIEDGVASGRMPSRPDWMVCEQVAKTRWFVLADRLQTILDGLGIAEDVSIELLLMQLQPTSRLPALAIHTQSLTEVFPTEWALKPKSDGKGFHCPVPKNTAVSVGGAWSEEMREIVNEYLGSQNRREVLLSDERGYRILVCDFKRNILDAETRVYLIVRLMPMVVDGIVIGVEVFIDSHTYITAGISASQAAVVAEAFCAYLSHATLWEHAPGLHSGSVDGVNFVVDGVVQDPGVAMIADAILERLRFCMKRFLDEGAMPGDDGAYRGVLPIRSLDSVIDIGRNSAFTEIDKAH